MGSTILVVIAFFGQVDFTGATLASSPSNANPTPASRTADDAGPRPGAEIVPPSKPLQAPVAASDPQSIQRGDFLGEIHKDQPAAIDVMPPCCGIGPIPAELQIVALGEAERPLLQIPDLQSLVVTEQEIRLAVYPTYGADRLHLFVDDEHVNTVPFAHCGTTPPIALASNGYGLPPGYYDISVRTSNDAFPYLPASNRSNPVKVLYQPRMGYLASPDNWEGMSFFPEMLGQPNVLEVVPAPAPAPAPVAPAPAPAVIAPAPAVAAPAPAAPAVPVSCIFCSKSADGAKPFAFKHLPDQDQVLSRGNLQSDGGSSMAKYVSKSMSKGYRFLAAANFPISEFDEAGRTSEREGATVYEGMRFLTERDGKYSVDFAVSTPALPTTIRLQFLVTFQHDADAPPLDPSMPDYGANTYTVTVPPIKIAAPTTETEASEANIHRIHVDGYSATIEAAQAACFKISDIQRTGTARFGIYTDK